jgi:phage terminase Nu1 subunit (DNA packaging protein)
MTDAERVEALRKLLAPVITWYRNVEAEREAEDDPDDAYDASYLYDETVNQFDQFHHGVYQQIIEILL